MKLMEAKQNEVEMCLRAYSECSERMQKRVQEMFNIYIDPKSTEDERHMAAHTIVEIIFPNGGMDLEESEQIGADASNEMCQAIGSMDKEEAAFAAKLEELMIEKGISQTELAGKIDVSQPAIANMLVRQCRPQRRTILKIAKALRVSPADLWPAFDKTI